MVIVLLLVTIYRFLCFHSIEVISRIHCMGGSTLTVNPSQSMLTSKKMISSEGWKKITKTIWNPAPNQSHSSTNCQWQAYAITMVESRMPQICIFTKWNQWFQHTGVFHFVTLICCSPVEDISTCTKWRGAWNKVLSESFCNVKFSLIFSSKY